MLISLSTFSVLFKRLEQPVSIFVSTKEITAFQ